MKSTIYTASTILIALALAIPNDGSAQTNVTYGVKGGFNFATMSGDTYSGLGYKPGILLGVFASMPRGEKLDLQAEINYSQEGAQNSNLDFSSFSSVVYKQKLIYNYVNIPVSVIYPVSEKFSIQAGPQLGIRLAAKEKRTIKSGEPSPSDNSAGTRKFNDRIKLLYPSLTVGAQFSATPKVVASARLQYGPLDNVKSDAGDSEGTYPFLVQVAVGYRLGSKTL